jgi:hypothetical protein
MRSKTRILQYMSARESSLREREKRDAGIRRRCADVDA